MPTSLPQEYLEHSEPPQSMQSFGMHFIEKLATHFSTLKIPGRSITHASRRAPVAAQIDRPDEIQRILQDVLNHAITQDSQHHAQATFTAFLGKSRPDIGVLKFFNGWNETHKTTSLVSAKIIMRLSADTLSVPEQKLPDHAIVMAHMHEVAKDDFGLGHEGHDGMYTCFTEAFGASAWLENQYSVSECNAFSSFLYEIGVAKHTSAMDSVEHRRSIMEAMMVSIASELWNGREYNFFAQYIERKLLSVNASLSDDIKRLRNAKAYVTGHSGEVENKHGLHALAAAQAFARMTGIAFELDQLRTVMLDYNKRVGVAFQSLHDALT
ncbi:hypothetical protein ACIP1T_16045 [Pseudomonas japonica]|uniref:hypothetical protein n=1 Tax=Pseudomonas japonica TaxID=256466 RepID=UPI00381933C6